MEKDNGNWSMSNPEHLCSKKCCVFTKMEPHCKMRPSVSAALTAKYLKVSQSMFWYSGATLLIKLRSTVAPSSKRKSICCVRLKHCIRGQTCSVICVIIAVAKWRARGERIRTASLKLLASFVCRLLSHLLWLLLLLLSFLGAPSHTHTTHTLCTRSIHLRELPNSHPHSLPPRNQILISWRLLSYSSALLSSRSLLALHSGRSQWAPWETRSEDSSFLVHFFLLFWLPCSFSSSFFSFKPAL